MKIGLIDVDGHHFPNLALMRISSFFKARGDEVGWWSDIEYYDIVYMSKVFSDAYSPDRDTPTNATWVVRGGTGYAISLGQDGKEHFDQSQHFDLMPDMERSFPDYSLYPQYDFAVSMTSRGCPRGCSFCHVRAKEGCRSIKVADVSDFWCGQKEIKVLDPNLTACRDKRDLFRQYRETGAKIDFTQGLDIRLLNDEDVQDLNNMKLAGLHFAWDNPEDDLAGRFAWYDQVAKKKVRSGKRATVYVLVNYSSTIEQDLYRIYTLQDKYDPYVMVYDKPNAPKEIRRLQRWCNNKRIFKSCPKFEDYGRSV